MTVRERAQRSEMQNDHALHHLCSLSSVSNITLLVPPLSLHYDFERKNKKKKKRGNVSNSYYFDGRQGTMGDRAVERRKEEI